MGKLHQINVSIFLQNLTKMPLCGGTSDAKEMNDEVKAICNQVGNRIRTLRLLKMGRLQAMGLELWFSLFGLVGG